MFLFKASQYYWFSPISSDIRNQMTTVKNSLILFRSHLRDILIMMMIMKILLPTVAWAGRSTTTLTAIFFWGSSFQLYQTWNREISLEKSEQFSEKSIRIRSCGLSAESSKKSTSKISRLYYCSLISLKHLIPYTEERCSKYH